MFDDQKIIPAISDHSALETFLKSDLHYGILMNFQLAQLPGLIKKMKQNQKKVLIHLELIKGLSSDIYGAIFLIQNLGIDGIISIKPKVIELSKKRGIIGIFRVFLKDSISLHQSISIIKALNPDALEVLPALKTDIIDTLKRHTAAAILLGGLIEDEVTLKACLKAGACAITTSKVALWET